VVLPCNESRLGGGGLNFGRWGRKATFDGGVVVGSRRWQRRGVGDGDSVGDSDSDSDSDRRPAGHRWSQGASGSRRWSRRSRGSLSGRLKRNGPSLSV
jgi:hypothetical protein